MVAATEASSLHFRYSIEIQGTVPDVCLASPEKSEQPPDGITTYHSSVVHQAEDERAMSKFAVGIVIQEGRQRLGSVPMNPSSSRYLKLQRHDAQPVALR